MHRRFSGLVVAVAILTAACARPAMTHEPASSLAPTAAPVVTSSGPSTAASLSPGQAPVSGPVDLVPAASMSPGSAGDTVPLDGPLTSPDTMMVRIYLTLEGTAGEDGLVPVLRELPTSESIEVSAVEALLAGPNPAERGAAPELSTWIPDGTRLLGLTVRDMIATVDLSREFAAPGDRNASLGRLGQIAYTLTVYPWIRAVAFTVEGRPLGALAGGEVVLSAPVGRADPRDIGPNQPFLESILLAIFVDGPSWGETLYEKTTVMGTARLASDRFTVELLGAAGQQLAKVWAVEPCPGPCGGGFEARLDFAVTEPQWGTLRVSEVDAAGEPIPFAPARDYPVWLVPIGSPTFDEPSPAPVDTHACSC